MLGTIILIIAFSLIVLLSLVITDIITYWWAYLLICLASVLLVMHDSRKNKK